MAKISINQRQLMIVQKEFRKIPQLAENGVKKVIAQGVIDIRRDTISPPNFPVRNNILRPSYTADAKGLEGSVYSEVEYAPHVEFGTSRQRAQPFLIPAFNKNVPRIERAIEIEIEKAIS
jgi:HK97 gp10 family phage protein